ncbi:MAG: murein L,D-transpeptidase [Rhizobiaceae bacterium]
MIPLAATAVALMMVAQPASAQGFFESLFGGGVKKRNTTDFPEAPAKPKPKAAVKVSGPSYYDYKPEALVRTDFSAITALGQQAGVEPVLTGSEFREATSGLNGYELLAEKAVAKALSDYYSTHPDFIWVSGLVPNERAREALRTLGDAESQGLIPAEYAVTVPQATPPANGDMRARLDELVRFEMALSAKVLRYVNDAQGGRIDPNKLSGYHDFPPKPVDMVAALTDLAGSQDVRDYMESRHPQNEDYRKLRVELEALRASEENAVVIDAKLLLRPGDSSPELPKVIKVISADMDDDFGGQFGEVLYRLQNSETYSQELVPAIKAAQERAGLKPDGVVGPRTVSAIAGVSKADRIAKVKIALEQLRWMPSDLGATRVFINQPAYVATYIENNEVKLETRTVIGKPSNQTSFFYDEIEQVDYNPYWGVPRSILVNEMLPRLLGDPGYLDRAGYEVTNAKGQRIPSASIDWGAYGSKIPYDVRQTPSEANALGELKILFPNKHAIYMHDTPAKDLFSRDMRAYSHGCIRLQDPRGMAAAVLGKSVDYVAEKLKQGHSSEQVTRKIPVYVAYFTAWPNLKTGKVEYFSDVYDRDGRLLKAIEKTDVMRTPASADVATGSTQG